MPTTEASDVQSRPPLKWAGGKRWQLPHLGPLWEPHRKRRLVEPFCGGLAVALGLRPDRALLNDTNPHLISFYRWLQRGLQIDIELKNDEALYYAHRRRFNELIQKGQAESREAASSRLPHARPTRDIEFFQESLESMCRPQLEDITWDG